MSFEKPHGERRQFGRRKSCNSGWVQIKGRPRLPCIIRNFSSRGALIELDVPSWLPFTFELVREGEPPQVMRCEIRHMTPTAVGLLFLDSAALETHRSVGPIGLRDEWSGIRSSVPLERPRSSTTLIAERSRKLRG